MKSLNYFFQKIAIIAILLISFFSMNLQDGKATVICPAGYSSYPIMNILVGDCYYNIDICYKCGPAGVTTSFIKIVRFIKLGNCTQTMFTGPGELEDAMFDAIVSSPMGYLGLFCSIPPCCEIPEDQPCTPALRREWKIVKPICWRLMKLSDGTVAYEACEDELAACVRSIFACTRNGIIDWQGTTGYSLENGWTLNCTTYHEGNFAPGQPMYNNLPVNTWSDCFMVRGLCNGY